MTEKQQVLNNAQIITDKDESNDLKSEKISRCYTNGYRYFILKKFTQVTRRTNNMHLQIAYMEWKIERKKIFLDNQKKKIQNICQLDAP